MLCDTSFSEQLSHEYEGDWSEPCTNWFDYFVQRKRFKQLLDKFEDEATIAELCTQFVNEANNVEKELSSIEKTPDNEEDIQYAQSKCACLWLCAASCLSAIKWNFGALIERGEWLASKLLLDRMDAYLQSPSSPPAIAAYAAWMRHSFTLMAYNRTLLPVTQIKANVIHSANNSDPNSLRSEPVKKLISELKEKLPQAIEYFEQMAVKPAEIAVPSGDSFIKPFLKSAPDTLEVGILGASLVLETPQIDFSIPGLKISPAALLNRANFELIVYKFSNGDLIGTKTHLQKLSGKVPTSENHLLIVSSETVNGYCLALGLKPIFPQAGSSQEKDMVVDEKLLTDDNSIFRKRRYFRQMAELQTSEPLKAAVIAENMARDIAEGQSIIIRPVFNEKATIDRFIKSLLRQKSLIADRNYFAAQLHYLSANAPLLGEELRKHHSELLTFGGVPKPITTIQRPSSIVVPGAQLLRALLASDNPYWRILIHFKLDTLKAAFLEMQKEPFITFSRYTHSKMMRYSDVLDEVVIGPTRSGHPLNIFHLLLLSKLHQLGSLGNIAQWKVYVDQYVSEINASQNQQLGRLFALELIRQQSSLVNASLTVPFAQLSSDLPLKCPMTKSLLLTDLRSLNNINAFLIQAMATLFNQCEYDFIIKKAFSMMPQNFPLLTLVQLLAAYGQLSTNQNIVGAFVENFTQLFVKTQGKRRNDNLPLFTMDRDQMHKLGYLCQLLKYIKEPSLLSSLIAFFSHLLNRSLLAENKVQLKVYANGIKAFGEEIELIGANHEAILECLDLLLRNSLKINPTNPELLRTAADVKYVQGELDESLCFYVECFVASKLAGDQQNDTATQMYLNEEFWMRMRICFTNLRLPSFAALICQFLEGQTKQQHLQKVSQTLFMSTFDSLIEAFPLMWDMEVVESVASFYEQNSQQQAVDQLIEWTCCPSLNPSTPSVFQLEKRRRLTRLLHVLAAHVFAVQL